MTTTSETAAPSRTLSWWAFASPTWGALVLLLPAAALVDDRARRSSGQRT